MQKLNSSVLKCLAPDCSFLPVISLESKGISTSNHPFVAAQALVCARHTGYGKEALLKLFPKFPIQEYEQPNWLSREQGKARNNEISRRK